MQLKILLFSILKVIVVSSQDPTTTDTAGETPVPDPGADAQPPGGTGGGDASAPPPPPAPVGGAPSLDAKIESRASVDIAAPALSPGTSAVNVQSLGVPQYNAHDNTFTTIYPMLCGGGVEALPGAGGVARFRQVKRNVVPHPELYIEEIHA
ncbi:unnamed protein product [Heligmosomoides polygyrus]|uniref:Secreted protein n=1 Tax=Heligmosomoides polygyrus TaxID=6339 RepID=A0A183GQ55_HELPZ|nr:unnamed protein product [Heligmosomoides polygyrus]